jgi:hypothetical protein
MILAQLELSLHRLGYDAAMMVLDRNRTTRMDPSTANNVRTEKGPIPILPCLVLVSCLIFLGGCSSRNETDYLLPIPDGTISAYIVTYPIRSKLDAVIVARRYIWTTRLRPVGIPNAVAVEEMTQAEASERIPGRLSQSMPSDARVWLVILHGVWEIMGPDPSHTITPVPHSGCVFSLFYADGRGGVAVGETACPD